MDNEELFAITIAHYLTPIRAYLEDPEVTEVMINRYDEVYIEKAGQMVRIPARFTDKAAYEAAVNNILQYTGKTLNPDNPLIDSRLPDGSRVHVACEPCSRFGTAVSIRKFSKDMLDIDWLIQLGAITEPAAEYMHIAVQHERNLLVAGGTSSGKTSLLNALSAFIPKGERIIVIEDSAELQLQQEHVVSMEARAGDPRGRGAVPIRELFRSSLRLRPDRIIIGEVRGGEALDMIQAMTSGHGGSMGTLHANNPVDALNRLETLALMSQVELPLHAIRAQVASAIDVIVQMSRHVGGKRQVTQITEIDALGDDGHHRTRDIFRLDFDPEADETEKVMQLMWSGERSAMAGQLGPGVSHLVTDLTRDVFATN